MLRVLIIDDEKLVREGLKTVIKWSDYNFYVCGEGVDGFDGLEKMDSLKPDLVLVDIKMPEMDGLEFIRQAKKKGHNAKFVILSGFSDFIYAKKAIELGVNSYLLKPVEDDELIEKVSALGIIISQEKELQVRNHKKHFIENVILSLLRGQKVDTDITSHIQNCEIVNHGSYQVAVISKLSKDCFSLEDSINNMYEKKSTVIPFSMDGITGIIFTEKDQQRNYITLDNYSGYVREKYGLEVVACVGRPVNSIYQLRVSYDDALEILENRFFYSRSTNVLTFKDIFNRSAENEELEEFDLPFCIERLFTAADAGDGNSLEKTVSKLFKVFLYKRYTEVKIKGLCINVLNEVFNLVIDYYPVLKKEIPTNSLIMTEIHDIQNFYKLKDYFLTSLRKLIPIIDNVGMTNILKKIQVYIDKNYERDLTLELLGELFGYNSSYLGKVFRNYSGDSFNSYLEKIRLENAKKMLLKGYKVNDVACKTGFKNVDYFYVKFKKYVGVSTSEYKNLYGEKKPEN